MATEANRKRFIDLFLQHVDWEANLDYQKMAEAFGMSSLEGVAFIKDVSREFQLDITPEDVEKLQDEGGNLIDLIP